MSGRMKLLIAYDGSKSADAALGDLRLAGLPRGVDAVVISVGELWLSLPSSYTIVEKKFMERPSFDLKEAQALAVGACERIRSNFPGWEIYPEAHVGSAAGEIIRKADEWRPDLIIVGSHGQSALGKFTIGSISQKVVTEARCPVRVARGQAQETDRPVRIIIGVDGSHDAKAAVDVVTGRVWPAGSEVRLVTATSSENMEELEYVQEIQHSPKTELSAVGLTVSSVISKGDPKHILLNQAVRFAADCIFVGSKGLSHPKRFLLGSVSMAVVTRAHCSVEVVRTE